MIYTYPYHPGNTALSFLLGLLYSQCSWNGTHLSIGIAGWTFLGELRRISCCSRAKKLGSAQDHLLQKNMETLLIFTPPKEKKRKLTWTLGPQSDPYCPWPNVAFLARNVVLRMHRTSTLWPLAMDEVAKSHICFCEHSNAKKIQKDPKSKEPIVVDQPKHQQKKHQPKHQQKNINPNINRGCCYFPMSTTCGSSTGPPRRPKAPPGRPDYPHRVPGADDPGDGAMDVVCIGTKGVYHGVCVFTR